MSAGERPPDERALCATFDGADELTVGLEEEAMLLDPDTLDLAPRATQVLGRLGDPQRFKPELPAAQLEVATAPAFSVDDAVAQLGAGRAAVLAACEGIARPAAAATHPFAAAAGELNPAERYRHLRSEYGPVARRQLVCALHVHVAVGSAERTLAVYNALRSRLPEIAALAANGPFHEGRDTGMASIRPKIAETLPRQGVPPALSSWGEYAEALRWCAAAGAAPSPRYWWFELRPHPRFGTLELRVPDAQTELDDAGAIAAVAQALVAMLRDHAEAGELRAPAPGYRIRENRWSAARHGIEGTMADLDGGRPEPTAERLGRLLGELRPWADRLGTGRWLERARGLSRRNGAVRQRELAEAHGLAGLTERLADGYRPGRS